MLNIGGLKSFIAANHFGIPFIGAPGVDWTRSEETFLSYLKDLQCSMVILFPDAGCTQNEMVATLYFETFMICFKAGIDVRVAWWFQENKILHRDVDELTENDFCVDEMELLSTRQFMDLFDLRIIKMLRESDWLPHELK